MDIESTAPPIDIVVPKPKLKFYHYVGDFFNILKAFIGTNYQALPFAFKNSGLLFGILGVLGIAALTDHCCQLMVRCKYYVIEIILAEERQAGHLSEEELCELEIKLGRTLGYGDIGRKIFGNWCYHLIQVAVWFTQFTTCVAYFIFIGNTVYEFFPIVPVAVGIHNNSRPLNNLPAHYDLGYGSRQNAGYGVRMLDIHFVNNVNLSVMGPHLSNRRKRSIDSEQEYFTNVHGHNHPESSDFTDILSSQQNQNDIKIMSQKNAVIKFTAEPNITMVPYITNVTSTTPVTTPSTLPPIPPTPAIQWITSAPRLSIVVLFPLPFFLITSFIKKLRLIAPFSTIATGFLGIGAMSVFVYLIQGFTLYAKGIHWVQFATLPLFIGQLISAYEGIGCIIPIESSMVGNRWIFPWFLRGAVYTVFVILCSFGTVGYLRYGDDVEQIIVLNLKQHTPLSMFIDITLILSVLFTYPLQCFPSIEITETYFFGFLGWIKSFKKPQQERLEYDEIDSVAAGNVQFDGDSSSSDHRGLMESSVTSLELSIAKATVNDVILEVPAWQRNVLRVVLTLSIVAFAIACRNSYAYLSAFTGAVGCSLLAYIIPCAIHMKVKWRSLSDENKVKDILIIIFSVIASILTLVAIVLQIASGASI